MSFPKPLQSHKQHRCPFCGLFFHPDPRVGDRQVCCLRPACMKKREKAARNRWKKANPDADKGRYPKLKLWRGKNPGYQKERRLTKKCEIRDEIGQQSPKIVHLLIMGSGKREIRDTIGLVKPCRCGFASHGWVFSRDTRHDSHTVPS